jgi:sugar lactone lactonase YvrE
VYVADTDNNSIKRISPAGVVSEFFSTGLSKPHGVGVNAAGDIYITDTYNNKVKKISNTGTVTSLGSNFIYPSGIAVGADGAVYVTDTGHSALKKIIPCGEVSTLADGTAGTVTSAPTGKG